MRLFKALQSPAGGGGFHAPPPTSRPPTKNYDRQSQVLVVDESDEILKFMKMHLNRYFSHVVVAKTATDGVAHLKQREFDVVICDGAPVKKANADFIKKLAANWRHIPIILTEGDEGHVATPTEFPQVMVIDVVKKPVDLDTFHVAIRRALNIRSSLKELDGLLPLKYPLGETIRTAPLSNPKERAEALIAEMRTRLTEEIVD